MADLARRWETWVHWSAKLSGALYHPRARNPRAVCGWKLARGAMMDCAPRPYRIGLRELKDTRICVRCRFNRLQILSLMGQLPRRVIAMYRLGWSPPE